MNMKVSTASDTGADIATVFRLIPKELLKDSIAGSVFASALVTVLLVAGNTHYRHKYREELTTVAANWPVGSI